MRFIALFPALLAVALGSPMLDSHLDSLADGEVHIFKRDTVISPRDIELAKRNDVNLEEMFMHSVVKRDDGNHITIWVAKNYHEFGDEDAEEVEAAEKRQAGEGTSLAERSKVNVVTGARTSTGSCWIDATCCKSGTNYGDTGPNAPYTGGAHAIVNWGNNCGTSKFMFSGPRNNWVGNIVVAGSNSGANMRFIMGIQNINGERGIEVGCRAIGRITREARDAHQRYVNGAWRLRASGRATCDLWWVKDGIWHLPGNYGVQWWIDSSGAWVN